MYVFLNRCFLLNILNDYLLKSVDSSSRKTWERKFGDVVNGKKPNGSILPLIGDSEKSILMLQKAQQGHLEHIAAVPILAVIPNWRWRWSHATAAPEPCCYGIRAMSVTVLVIVSQLWVYFTGGERDSMESFGMVQGEDRVLTRRGMGWSSTPTVCFKILSSLFLTGSSIFLKLKPAVWLT